VFDLNITKLLFLGVVALIVFGPERLPGLAAQAGRALRELRRMADGAKSELSESLGPEFSQLSQLNLTDLNPRSFVRKHLVDELTGDGVLLNALSDNGSGGSSANGSSANGSAVNGSATTRPATATLPAGESPPFDSEAT
jgi:sec-independent protein translocase protein TatB